MKRFSEEQFRVYEPIIEAAVLVLPSRYTIETPWMGYAQATVSRNLREAIQSLNAHPEWVTSVNRRKFIQYFPLLQVAEDVNMVIVQLRNRGQIAASTSAKCTNVIEFEQRPFKEDIDALLVMAASRRFTGIRLVNSDWTIEAIQQRIMPVMDVVLLKDGDDITIL